MPRLPDVASRCGLLLVAIAVAAAPVPTARVSRSIAGSVVTYTTMPGDTLASVAARFGVEVGTLATDNNLRADTVLRAGRVLQVDARHIVPAILGEDIVINIPQRMLFTIDEAGVPLGYPVAVGRPDWPSPIGQFEIGTKEIDPTWDVPLSIQREMARAGRRVLTTVLPGPNNPLGDRWLGLKDMGIGIHGTNQPTSIFRVTTHGCIRLHPDDIRALYDRVEVGTPVRLVYEPVLVAVGDDGRVWLEVHRDVYGRVDNLASLATELLKEAGVEAIVDPALIRRCVEEHSGRPCGV